MPNCDNRILTNIVYDACSPATKGLKAIGYLCNFDDVDHAAMKANLKGSLYTDFILNEGAKLYKIYQSGKTPFSGTTSEAQVGTFRTTWNKTLPFVLLNNGADITENIVDKIANGRFVFIVENSYPGTNGDNAFEVIGIETGAMLSEGNNEKYNEDYGGGWSLTMLEENAPSAGLYILKESVSATRNMLDGMLAG